MKKKIMVMGAGGATGEATAHMLKKRGYEPMLYDPPKGMHCDPLEADVSFVCVPAHTREDGTVDVGEIHFCLGVLREGSVAAIRSTVPPGATDKLQQAHSWLDVYFVPEFLTEATRFEDAEKPARLIIGIPSRAPDEGFRALALANELRRLFPDCDFARVLNAPEAEMIKYAGNAFYALKVAYMNQLFDLCESTPDVNWSRLHPAILADPFIAQSHTDVRHKNYRGFGGKCLPKDAKAICAHARSVGMRMTLVEEARLYNQTLIGK